MVWFVSKGLKRFCVVIVQWPLVLMNRVQQLSLFFYCEKRKAIKLRKARHKRRRYFKKLARTASK